MSEELLEQGNELEKSVDSEEIVTDENPKEQKIYFKDYQFTREKYQRKSTIVYGEGTKS